MSEYPFRNLVFEGGGVKGLAYIGALKALENENNAALKNIKRVGGTSVGAITALLVGLGITSNDITRYLNKRRLKELVDNDWGRIIDTARLFKSYGWNKGEKIKEWIGEAIEHATGNPNATFEDIKILQAERNFKDMYFVGTNLSTHSSKIFCYELTPKIPLIDAVIISMSIPIFYPAITEDKINYYVDGGVLMNYPIRLFDEEAFIENQDAFINLESFTEVNEMYTRANTDRIDRIITNITGTPYKPNPETLGFRLDSKDEIHLYNTNEAIVHEIKNFYEFSTQLILTLMEYQNHTHLNSTDKQRTIYLDVTGVKATDFDIPDAKIKNLVDRACTDTSTFLSRFKQL